MILGEKFAINKESHTELLLQIDAIRQKIDAGLNGDLVYDPNLISLALNDICRGRFYDRINEKIVKLLYGGNNLFSINAVDGLKTIANSKKDIFREGVDAFFKSIDKPEKSTKKTDIQIYGLRGKPATAFQVFSSITNDLDALCFTQHQIADFCACYGSLIKFAIFLYKQADIFYTIAIYRYANLRASIRTLNRSGEFNDTLGNTQFIAPKIL